MQPECHLVCVNVGSQHTFCHTYTYFYELATDFIFYTQFILIVIILLTFPPILVIVILKHFDTFKFIIITMQGC